MAAAGGKPLASLSSGLLARKGQAKPAMRPQGYGGFASSPAAALDDLGWNDMGAAPVAPAFLHSPVPPVLALREALKDEVEGAKSPSKAGAERRPVSLATAERIGRDSAKLTKKGKAAFTLRLDPERHLRLRLASALDGRSAQLLVTEAVDALLAAKPEVAALIAQLPEPKRRQGGPR